MLSGKEDWCYMIDDMLTQETRILKKIQNTSDLTVQMLFIILPSLAMKKF